jgi:hypothetical protein
MPDTNQKVGSDPDAARTVAGEGDFGIHADDRTERNYASQQTKKQDPGHGTQRSHDNLRTSGVGGNDSGRGSSSGGDVDTGADALIGLGDPHNTAPPQPRTAVDPADRPVLDNPVVNPDPARAGTLDNGSSTSADGMNNETLHHDDSFRGDVTMDEAAGNSSK